ncbi:MAG: tRNA preQ1(34) S-adenosylmethionine ribosyltransferase-isomerase QueA [Kiritimatiellia bacterium]
MKTSDFDYALPEELIAQEPLPERDAARMMVLHRETGTIEHRHVRDLPEYLKAGDILVINDTLVIPARVFGSRRDTGGRVEVLLLEPLRQDHATSAEPMENLESLWHRREGLWRGMCRCRSRLSPGTELRLAGDKLKAIVWAREANGLFLLRLQAEAPVAEILREEGESPLPPYIKRRRRDPRLAQLDRQRYQTVYATKPGAVAAPTAGLHLTTDLLERLERKGVRTTPITLHVGPGTFRPVTTERVEDHQLHAERYEVSEAAAAAIRRCRGTGGRVVAVGTTTVRVLETVTSEEGEISAGRGETSFFIYPPYSFRAVDLLLTNFHLPRSTLLMMVAAFAAPPSSWLGRKPETEQRENPNPGWVLLRKAYQEALALRYRFYSYGDCMLII